MPDGTNIIQPAVAIAKRFWRLYAGKDDAPILLRFIKHGVKGAQEYNGSLDELWPTVIAMQADGYDCYFVANQPKAGSAGTTKDDDIEVARVMFADFDKGNMPTEWHIQPHLIVHTSTVREDAGRMIEKYQVYWIVDGAPAEKKAYAAACQRIIDHYSSDPSVKNIGRVMRLPGSLHLKGHPTQPQLVTFTDNNTALARVIGPTFDDFMAGLPAGKRIEKTQEQAGPDEAASRDYLSKYVLAGIDPNRPRAGFLEILWGFNNTPIIATKGIDTREWKRTTAQAFINGLLYKGDYVPPADARFRGEAEIDHIMEEEPRGPGDTRYTFGTLVHYYEVDNGGRPIPFAMWEARQKAAREQREKMRQAGATPESEKNPRFNPMRLSDVFNEPDPTPLIAGMIMEGENICFVGPPKSGKSFLAIDIGMSIAFGQRVVGMHEAKKFGAVVYLSGEGHRGMKRRLKAWCQARGITPAQVEKSSFVYNKGVPSTAAGMAECVAFIDEIRKAVGEPVLVVIDTMSRSLGVLNENEASTAAQYLELTEGLRDSLKCTVLTIAHATNKGTGKIVHDIRGSSGFSAGFDAVWITIKNEQTGIVELRTLWLTSLARSSLG
jgi:hypothetical protein